MRLEDELVQPLTHARDLADVFLLRMTFGARFWNRRAEIAFVDDDTADTRQPLAESRDPHRGRSHVDAPAPSAQIERHAENVDGTE